MVSISNISNGLIEAAVLTLGCIFLCVITYSIIIKFVRKFFGIRSHKSRVNAKTLVVGAVSVLFFSFFILILPFGTSAGIKIALLSLVMVLIGVISGVYFEGDAATILLNTFSVGVYGGLLSISLIFFKIVYIYMSSPVDSPNYNLIIFIIGVPLPLLFGISTLLPNTVLVKVPHFTSS